MRLSPSDWSAIAQAHAAVSSAYAANATLQLARQQLVATWAAAFIGALVVVVVAIPPVWSGTVDKRRRLQTISISILNAVELLEAHFTGLKSLDPETKMGKHGPSLMLCEGAAAAIRAAIALGIDDRPLQEIALNVAVIASGLSWQFDAIAARSEPPTVKSYLEEDEMLIGALADARGHLMDLWPRLHGRYRTLAASKSSRSG